MAKVKVEVKSLDDDAFELEVPTDYTVADMKLLINEERQYGAPQAAIKLLFAGKVLSDDKSLVECNMGDGDFLVVMVSKLSRAGSNASSTATTAAPAAAGEAAVSQCAPIPSHITTSAAAAAVVVTSSASSASPTANETIGAAVDQSAVNDLMGMGFPRDLVIEALQAAFNDPHIAANYLVTGIPEGAFHANALDAEVEAKKNYDQKSDDQAQAALKRANDLNPEINTNSLPGLRDPNCGAYRYDPEIKRIRQVLRESPALLREVIWGLAHQNMQLLREINESPAEVLMGMLFGADADAGAGAPQDIHQAGAKLEMANDLKREAQAAAHEIAHNDGASRQQQVIDVDNPGMEVLSESDEEAVARISHIVQGSSREDIVEAYITSGRNEELAINLLFDMG
ncbi:unnamed protein product [Chrysoparadoxa australica]